MLSDALRTILRLLRWRLQCLLRRPAIISLPRWNARFFLPARSGGEGTTMIFAVREEYEVELAHLDRFVSPGDVVVDAGANCGIYTVAAAMLVGASGQVIAFEPGDRAADVFQRNVTLNCLKNVRLCREALSDHVGQSGLYYHRGPVSYSLAADSENDDRFIEVQTTTLDAALERAGVDRVDFLKLDIEGAEELALRGARSVLTRSHPVIVFELNPTAAARFDLSTDGAWRYLEDLGYRFFRLDPAGRLTAIASPPPEDKWEFCNTVAIHADEWKRFRREEDVETSRAD
jgi:FkbM family methyltransferase